MKNVIITPATILFDNDTNKELTLVNGNQVEIIIKCFMSNGTYKERKITGKIIYVNQDGIKILSERFIEWDLVKEINYI